MTTITSFSFNIIKEKSALYEKNIMDDDFALAGELFAKNFIDSDKEIFAIILLDEKKKVIGINDVSIGSLNSSIVHPREVFKVALAAKAKYIIAGHNHPSGCLWPSKEDEKTTKRLMQCGNAIGIKVLASMILGIDGDGTNYKII